MLKHIFLAGYAGDPTVGYDLISLPPYDCTELVQPDVGDLYPPAPADMVLVYVFSQAGIEDAAALTALKVEYTYIGSVAS